MKRLSMLGLMGTLCFGSNVQAQHLIPPSEPLEPGDKFLIRFDSDMVEPQAVGPQTQVDFLEIAPPSAAQYRWASARVLEVELKDFKHFAQVYQLTYNGKTKNLKGQNLPTKELGEVKSIPFKVLSSSDNYRHRYSAMGLRDPRVILQFNDEVDLKELEKTLRFVTDNPERSVGVKAHYFTLEDAKNFYGEEAQPTVAEGVAGTKPVFQDGVIRKNAVVIEAATLLEEGGSWKLMVTAPLRNLSGTTSIAASTNTNALSYHSVEFLTIKEVKADTKFDQPHEIYLELNKRLFPEAWKEEQRLEHLKKHVQVTPAVEDLELSYYGSIVTLKGSFEFHTPYHVEVLAGLLGQDQLPLRNALAYSVTFAPDEPFVSTAANMSQVMAKVSKGFDVYAANFNKLRIKAKRLNTAQYVEASRLQEDNYRSHINASSDKERAELKPLLPFEAYPGENLFTKEIPNTKGLQQSSKHVIPWKDILGGANTGLVFLEVEAEPMEGASPGTRVTRCLVNVTDLNALVKHGLKDYLILATSTHEGHALSGAKVRLLSEKGDELQTLTTNADGLAQANSKKKASWLELTHGDDALLLPLEGESQVPFWSSNIEEAWGDDLIARPQVFSFTDRPLYREGDTLHFKAYVRQRHGDDLTVFKVHEKARLELVLLNDNGYELTRRNVTLDDQGNVDSQLTLPKGQLGQFYAILRYHGPSAYEDESPRSANTDDDETSPADVSELTRSAFRIEDYKPNSFEVHLADQKETPDQEFLEVPLHANYLMGKPLTKAKVQWSLELEEYFQFPEAYWGYDFGPNSRPYYQSEDGPAIPESEKEEVRYWAENAETELGADGSVRLKLPLPPKRKLSHPQRVNLSVEITDVNQQTLTKQASYVLPGADFVIGAKLQDHYYAKEGEPSRIDVVAIDAFGKPYTSSVKANVKVERQDWNIVRMEGAGGAIVSKNQVRLESEYEGEIEILNGKALLDFTPKGSGNYFVTLRAEDPNGKPLLTRHSFYAIGGSSYSWAWMDGRQLQLTTPKTKLKVGEEASIMVQAPFKARALVTVERNGIHRHFIQEISPENPVVKVQMQEQDYPNAYVSVYLLRPAAKSAHAVPFPEYRLGVIELKVDSDHQALTVKVKPERDEVQPGETVKVQAQVRDAKGQGVAGADVTLWAVDEGVLSLVNFMTPQAASLYYQPTPWAIVNYFALYDLLNEDESKRYRGNKGVIIGGGGDEANVDLDALRKNFIATAYWNGSLRTDAQGKVEVEFTAPDSLTRYRIMTLAADPLMRFGSGESAFKIRKPLIVEPVLPRFATRGDTLALKALIHNDTGHDGTFEVSVNLDEHARFTKDQSQRRVDSVQLKAGEQKNLELEVQLIKRGEAVWQWSVKGQEHSDQIESRLQIAHPLPSLREAHFVQLTKDSESSAEMMQRLSQQIRGEEGVIKVTASPSRLLEMEGALQYLFRYPHGCAEQTVSQMIPYLNLPARMDAFFSDRLSKENRRRAIEAGVQRLVSLRNYDGSFGYWTPDNNSDLFISAYVGYALFKAKDWGVPVDESVTTKLVEFLQEAVRSRHLVTKGEHHKNSAVALALYTLARAKHPEIAIQNKLYEQRDLLSREGRAYLALSLCLTQGKTQHILELTDSSAPLANYFGAFSHDHHAVDGMRLVTYAHIGQKAKAQQLMNELFRKRTAAGHWGSTYTNAWVLTGILTNTAAITSDFSPHEFTIHHDGNSTSHVLNSPFSKQVIEIPFSQEQALPKELELALVSGKETYAKIEVEAFPHVEGFEPQEHGYLVERSYHQVAPDGTITPSDQFEVGDMVLVNLKVTSQNSGSYLVIEDPYPSVFEVINPNFVTQNRHAGQPVAVNDWTLAHRELRQDRFIGYTRSSHRAGSTTIQYLARVVAEGVVHAPPTKVEEMYHPNAYGIGTLKRVEAKALQHGKK